MSEEQLTIEKLREAVAEVSLNAAAIRYAKRRHTIEEKKARKK